MKTKTERGNRWEAVAMHDFNKYTIRDELGRIVATTPGSADTTDQRLGSPYRAEENRKNALLLASAPDLLAALRAIADMTADADTDHAQLSALCVAIAQAAIEKYEGKGQ